MMTAERILAKLASCRPYYQRLLELRPALVKPEVDWVVWSAAERNLQLALECAIDVGEMLISWKRWERPEENRDVFRILGEHGFLDRDLARRLADAAGMRNVLVHRYGELDAAKVRHAILHDLKDLEEFAREVERLLA